MSRRDRGLIIAVALTIACGGEVRQMNPDANALILEFRTQLHNREEAAKKILPLLKPGMNASDVISVLGAPGGMAWQYTLFYSSFMSVQFAGDSKVIAVNSDLMREAVVHEALSADSMQREIDLASSQFKAQPYRRQEPAKKLIPMLKPGMGAPAVEDLLGPPNAKYWDYPLVPSGRSSLRVGFDTADKLTEATIIQVE